MKQVYRDSAAFVLALPLVAALPFTAELIQHVIEVRAGMFDSLAAAEAAGADPGREWFGLVKTFTLFLLLYPVARFIAFGRDRGRALTVTRRSAWLFGGVLLFSVGTIGLYRLGGMLIGQVTDSQSQMLLIGLAGFFLMMLFEIFFAAWKIAGPLGNARISIARSFRLMQPRLLRSFGFTVAMMMPLMILHYGLNIAAIGRSTGTMWALLLADTAVTAYLGIVLAATVCRIAHRAAGAAGVTLTESEEVERATSAPAPSSAVPG